MTLDEFVIEVNDSIHQFRKDWLEQRELNTDMFPLEMSGGDWYEHFIEYDPEVGL